MANGSIPASDNPTHQSRDIYQYHTLSAQDQVTLQVQH